MAGKRIAYDLHPGMVLEKKYNGKQYRLYIIREGDELSFKLDNRTFSSMTAAAKHVVGSAREISGPRFWKAPKL